MILGFPVMKNPGFIIRKQGKEIRIKARKVSFSKRGCTGSGEILSISFFVMVLRETMKVTPSLPKTGKLLKREHILNPEFILVPGDFPVFIRKRVPQCRLRKSTARKITIL
jgi:hypothetical protein